VDTSSTVPKLFFFPSLFLFFSWTVKAYHAKLQYPCGSSLTHYAWTTPHKPWTQWTQEVDNAMSQLQHRA
jgi:hypothetical protein